MAVRRALLYEEKMKKREVVETMYQNTREIVWNCCPFDGFSLLAEFECNVNGI